MNARARPAAALQPGQEHDASYRGGAGGRLFEQLQLPARSARQGGRWHVESARLGELIPHEQPSVRRTPACSGQRRTSRRRLCVRLAEQIWQLVLTRLSVRDEQWLAWKLSSSSLQLAASRERGPSASPTRRRKDQHASRSVSASSLLPTANLARERAPPLARERAQSPTYSNM